MSVRALLAFAYPCLAFGTHTSAKDLPYVSCVRVFLAREGGAVTLSKTARVRAGDDVDQELAPALSGQAAQAHSETVTDGGARLGSA